MSEIRTDQDTVAALLSLIRSALLGVPADIVPTETQWEDLLRLAREQAVLGLVYQGVGLLPPEVPVPEKVSFRLMMEADRIRRRSARVRAAAETLTGTFEAGGLHPVVLKGPAVAALYPDPLLRESGDIDLYFPPGEFGKAAPPHGRSAPDGSVHYTYEGIDIDQHPRFFDLHVAPDRLPPVPSPEATLLMLSAHIRKHCMGAGIGLRQLCDMAVARRALEYDPEQLDRWYREAGMRRWNRLLTAFLDRYLDAGTDGSTTGREDPGRLLNIILEGGNFGHYAKTRQDALRQSPLRRKLDTFGRFLRRVPFSLRYAPRELLPFVADLAKGNL